ncbi:hypothetical protein IWQ62_002960 [Dispira parvispora]|uniref:Peptidase S26 domain-containing protein n=1 Tax=Dispira parvispora TaxID=1520584 RepID=A0A9W8E3C4_9FUNG|nr:hypothetical protein IWQ62_002960 [Dispira parvispora]
MAYFSLLKEQLRQIRPQAARFALFTLEGCLLGLFLKEHIVGVAPCYGPSMLPTLHATGDYLLFDRFSHRLGNIQTGDIVLCTSPSDPGKVICKRVLGLPGDSVDIDPRRATTKKIKIPPGHVWLQGDNMAHSVDSRFHGPIPMGLLQGKVRAVLFPSFKLVQGGLQKIGEVYPV